MASLSDRLEDVATESTTEYSVEHGTVIEGDAFDILPELHVGDVDE